MKKVLALLLVLVLAIGMFAACGTDSGNNEETKDTANNATTEGGNDETKPSEENGNNTEGKTPKTTAAPTPASSWPRPAAMSSSATPMATSRTCSRLLPITPMCSSSAAPT